MPEGALEAPLQKGFEGEELDKKLVLSYDGRAGEYDVSFEPPDSDWNELKEIRVKLSGGEYERLHSRRVEVLRFGSQSIDLSLVDDLSSFQ